MSDIWSFFKKNIAKSAGVKLRDVTPDFIRRQRERFIYPNMHFEVPFGLVSLTGKQWDEVDRIAEELLRLSV